MPHRQCRERHLRRHWAEPRHPAQCACGHAQSSLVPVLPLQWGSIRRRGCDKVLSPTQPRNVLGAALHTAAERRLPHIAQKHILHRVVQVMARPGAHRARLWGRHLCFWKGGHATDRQSSRVEQPCGRKGQRLASQCWSTLATKISPQSTPREALQPEDPCGFIGCRAWIDGSSRRSSDMAQQHFSSSSNLVSSYHHIYRRHLLITATNN